MSESYKPFDSKVTEAIAEKLLVELWLCNQPRSAETLFEHANLWASVTLMSIKSALSGLEERGLASSEPFIPSDPHGCIVYTITDAGGTKAESLVKKGALSRPLATRD